MVNHDTTCVVNDFSFVNNLFLQAVKSDSFVDMYSLEDVTSIVNSL